MAILVSIGMASFGCRLEAPSVREASRMLASFDHRAFTSCSQCHASTRPLTPITANDPSGHLVTNFNHLISGMGDCVSCHQAALRNMLAMPPLRSWANTGTEYPAALTAITAPDQGATDVSVPVVVPVWSGTSITTVVSNSIVLPQTMNHGSIEVQGLLSNCSLCHSGASTGSYRPGYFHQSLSAQPKTCGDCHGSGTLYSTGAPTNGMPTGFVGTTGAGRNPASPEMNHFAKGFSQDCSVCHTQPGITWASANFHSSLTMAGKAQPAACLECHANNRPSGWVPATPATATPTQFNHAYALGDCVSCHMAPASTQGMTPPPASMWANGVFHAGAGPQTSCVTCHQAQRPTGTTGWMAVNTNAPFDYSLHGNGMDCVSCHAGTSAFTAMSGWSGGFYAHSRASTLTCVGCHTAPTTQWYPNAGSITFNHSGVGDCAGCHMPALTNVIAQGASPSNAAWVGTGANMPSGLIGNKTLTVTQNSLVASANPITSYVQVSSSSSTVATLPLNILHSSLMIPSIHFDANNQLKCTDCHDPTSVANGYKNGLFHTNPATGTLWPVQPTSCKDCHQNMLPTGIVGASLRYLDHSALLTNGQTVVSAASDCSVCHAQPGVGGSWANGVFHGKITTANPKLCSSCHYFEVQPILNTITNRMKHFSSQVTDDCATCHVQPTAAQIASSGYPNVMPSIWSGGMFHSRIQAQPAACNDCHSIERPTVTTASAADPTQPVQQYMNHASSWAQGDCATCHAGEVKALPANTSPTAWSKSDSFHTGVSAGVTSCKECHGLGNGSAVAGTGNTIPAGVTTTSTVSSVGNSGGTVTPYWSAPASGQPIYDLMTHLDGNVTGKDCLTCHATPTANAGPAYAVWQAGKFHANVPSVDTVNGKCASCHYNIMPNSSYVQYNHTGLVSASGTVATPMGNLTSDCSSCHASNIGVSWKGAAVTHSSTFLQSGTSCVVCHTSGGPTSYATGGTVLAGTAVGMPTAAVSVAITTVGGNTGQIYNYSISFQHVNAVASYNGFTTTAYDLSKTSCLYCHGSAANAIVVTSGSNTIAAVPATGTTGWMSGTMGGVVRTGTTFNHTLAPTGFTYTPGAAAPISGSTGGSTVPACVTCHYPLYQAVRIADPSHPSTTRDCKSCHNVGSNWNG